jgi:hypothetical protein
VTWSASITAKVLERTHPHHETRECASHSDTVAAHCGTAAIRTAPGTPSRGDDAPNAGAPGLPPPRRALSAAACPGAPVVTCMTALRPIIGHVDTPPNWALTRPESALAVKAPAETSQPSSRCVAAKRCIPQPTLQVLLYPVLDLSAKTRSRTLFSDGFFLSKLQQERFVDLYLGGTGLAADDPRVSPLKAADLSGLAPL